MSAEIKDDADQTYEVNQKAISVADRKYSMRLTIDQIHCRIKASDIWTQDLQLLRRNLRNGSGSYEKIYCAAAHASDF